MDLFEKLKSSIPEDMLSKMTDEVKKQAKDIDVSNIKGTAKTLLDELIKKVKDGKIDVNELVSKVKSVLGNVKEEDVKKVTSKLGDLAKKFLNKE